MYSLGPTLKTHNGMSELGWEKVYLLESCPSSWCWLAPGAQAAYTAPLCPESSRSRNGVTLPGTSPVPTSQRPLSLGKGLEQPAALQDTVVSLPTQAVFSTLQLVLIMGDREDPTKVIQSNSPSKAQDIRKEIRQLPSLLLSH